MSHLTCPVCGSTEHVEGYGLAAGPLGTYIFCNGCDELLDFRPDVSGLREEDAADALAKAEAHRQQVWGTSK